MKILLPILLFPILSYSQQKAEGYANFGLSVFGTRKVSATAGAVAGVGIKTGDITTGFSLDIYTFSKEKLKYVILSADFRAYVLGLEKTVSPFISAQPGFVIYNKTIAGITQKGSFSFGANAGVRIKPGKKGPGVLMSGGYQNISFKTNSRISRSGGVKLNVAISI